MTFADTRVPLVLTGTEEGQTRMDFIHEGLKSELGLIGHGHGLTSALDRLEAFLTR